MHRISDLSGNSLIIFAVMNLLAEAIIIKEIVFQPFTWQTSLKYFPGAPDNGSGTAMVLDLARYFSFGKKPFYTIAFMLFSGEEAIHENCGRGCRNS